MTEAIKSSKAIDLKGLACPMPVVKMSKAIKEIAVGEVIECETSDPGARADFPAWARTSGHEIIKVEEEGKKTRFFIKRNK